MAIIIWSDNAQSNLIEIRQYIAQHSYIQADLIIESIYQKAQILLLYPEIGKEPKELPNRGYREILFKTYRIIYKLQPPDIIYIMSVYHSSRLLGNNPAFSEEF